MRKFARVAILPAGTLEPNYIIVFSGLSSQKSAHERSQEFGFGAALKRKLQLITWLVRLADTNFFERSL